LRLEGSGETDGYQTLNRKKGRAISDPTTFLHYLIISSIGYRGMVYVLDGYIYQIRIAVQFPIINDKLNSDGSSASLHFRRIKVGDALDRSGLKKPMVQRYGSTDKSEDHYLDHCSQSHPV